MHAVEWRAGDLLREGARESSLGLHPAQAIDKEGRTAAVQLAIHAVAVVPMGGSTATEGREVVVVLRWWLDSIFDGW